MCEDVGNRLRTIFDAVNKVAHMTCRSAAIVELDDCVVEPLCLRLVSRDFLNGNSNQLAAIDEETSFLTFKQQAVVRAVADDDCIAVRKSELNLKRRGGVKSIREIAGQLPAGWSLPGNRR